MQKVWRNLSWYEMRTGGENFHCAHCEIMQSEEVQTKLCEDGFHCNKYGGVEEIYMKVAFIVQGMQVWR